MDKELQLHTMLEFSRKDFKLLQKIKKYLARHINKEELPELGYYSSLNDEKLWLIILSQFCVMGGAGMYLNLKMNEQKLSEFQDDMRLDKLLSLRKGKELSYVTEHVSKTLSKATRFHDKQANKIVELLTNQKVIKRRRIVLLHNLSHKKNSYEDIRSKLIERMHPYFKLKSASDFMIKTGLSNDVIALDTRIVGILREHFNLRVSVNQVQNNKKIYIFVEQSLRDACKRLHLSLACLDRALFKFSGTTAVDFILRDI